jgi:hypothetical protein
MTFSLESYRALIKSALDAGFEPTPFDAASWPTRAMLLRHDVDYSLDMAVELARVNAELGVAGTFFILLRGHAYTALSPKSTERISELASLGQRLGLHAPATHEENLAADFAYVSSQIQLDRVFSWHNPTPQIIEKHRDRDSIDGLVNVYSKRFLDRALYRSDSNFGKTYEQLVEAFDGEREAVHLLAHPINWVAGGGSMIEVFEHAWPYLIRECEAEARTNRVYSERFPKGMPETILTDFSRLWREAAG